MEKRPSGTSKTTLVLAGVAALFLVVESCIFRATPPTKALRASIAAPLPPEPTVSLRTNKPPTSAIIGYQDPHSFFIPPAWPTNAKAAELLYSSNLIDWRGVVTNLKVVVSNSGYSYIVYNSNFLTHVVVPIKTNTYIGITWTIIWTNGPIFFRYKEVTN